MNLPRERHVITVNLDSGGSLQLVADFNLFDLSADDREFVYAIRDLMKKYAARPTVMKTGDQAEAAGRAAYVEATEPESDMERDRR